MNCAAGPPGACIISTKVRTVMRKMTGIACSRRVDEVEHNVFHESSRLNSTWGGNLVDMVRCTRYLEIMVEEDILENVRKQSEILMAGLRALQAKYPDRISNVRGRGLMCAFDLQETGTRNSLIARIFANGAIILPCGERTIRFRPPLNITEAEICRALDILGTSIEEEFAG